MPKIERHINHSMSLDNAKSTVSNLVDKVQKSYPSVIDTVDWNEDKTAADVKGKMFSGKFSVSDSAVDVDIDIKLPGLLAKPLMPKIESEIDENLKELKK